MWLVWLGKETGDNIDLVNVELMGMVETKEGSGGEADRFLLAALP